MPRTQKAQPKTQYLTLSLQLDGLRHPIRWWKRQNWLKRVVLILVAIIMLFVGTMYGIAQWYIARHADEPLQYGVTFVPSYARYYGLDAQDTMDAIIDDLGVRRFRLVSYWKDIEKTQGSYNFDELDWQFAKAEAAGATVSLAVGLRQPRWPECHYPGWALTMEKDQWYPKLKEYMTAVINRYKNSPALESYQLENEFFLSVFGECTDFSRDRLVDEYHLVKSLDNQHPVIISRSNNAVGLPINEPTPDQYGVSVYKRVWDKTITQRYFEYPFPAWFYGFLAGAQELLSGKDMIIHELQAEAWLPEGYTMPTAPLSEQNKSMTAERLHDRIEYGRATGMRTIDLWGVEWWYWRKVKHNDPSLWDTAKLELQNAKITNGQLSN